MRRTVLIAAMFAALVATAKAGNIDRTPEELKMQGRKVLGRLLPVPDDCIVTVETITNQGRRVIFQLPIPDTLWTMSQYPEVYFPDGEEQPTLRVWEVAKADESTPGPEAIAQWFLQNQRDPQRCIKLLHVWFNANRNKGRVVNFAYDRYASAYQAAGRKNEWLPVLEKELELAKAPESIYEIHKHMAKVYQDLAKADLAVRNWLLAQEAMRSQSDAYIATRYAIPFLEVARLFLHQGSTDKAAANLEQYLGTTHGKENPFEAIRSLGEIYESKKEFRKARALYMTVLGEDYGKNWHNQDYLRACQAPIRERVRLATADMPADSKTQRAQAEKNVTMGIQNGQISIDGKKMTPEEAAAYLKELHLGKRSDEARVVIIYSIGQKNYQLLHRAMAMIQAAGGIVAIDETVEAK